MPSALRSGGGSVFGSTPGPAGGDPLSATYNDLPSGLAWMPRGRGGGRGRFGRFLAARGERQQQDRRGQREDGTMSWRHGRDDTAAQMKHL
jgi:hypothetical protein